MDRCEPIRIVWVDKFGGENRVERVSENLLAYFAGDWQPRPQVDRSHHSDRWNLRFLGRHYKRGQFCRWGGGCRKPAISFGCIFSLGGQWGLNNPGAARHPGRTEKAVNDSFTATFERSKPRRLQQ